MPAQYEHDDAASLEKKIETAHNEYDNDDAAEVFIVTPEDDARVCRLIDRKLLPLLTWIYFLQILDKYLLGLAAVWGLQKDAKLVGQQYSLMASMNAIAQLIWLPFSSYLLVRVRADVLMGVLVFGWGSALLGMGFSHSFGALCATRFLLGLFEAACLPLFAMMTSQWYRRSEQPLRVACWYGTNGIATMLGSLMSFGIGHVKSPHIKSWQLVFIIPAILTILSGPLAFWIVPKNIDAAKWLNEHDKKVAYARVATNQTGKGSTVYKKDHLIEALWDPKTWLLIASAVVLNAGANVTGTFGGLLIKGLGFNNYITSLLNMPFGLVQLVVILLFAWLATRFKLKGPFLAACCIPVIAGAALLFANGRKKSDQTGNLVGYYMLGFIFAGNPLIVSWAISYTGGTTKKAIVMVIYNIGSSAGNIAGPFLFKSKDAPYYHSGLGIVLGMFGFLFAVTCAQMALMKLLNKRNADKREAAGLPRDIIDRSMMTKAEEDAAPVEVGAKADEDEDLTDLKNIKFVYVL